MATSIIFKADGINDELRILSTGFKVTANAGVTDIKDNPMIFNSIRSGEVTIHINQPQEECRKQLLEWMCNYEIKKNASISISQQALTEKARVISFENVCLTSYSEDIDKEQEMVPVTLSIAYSKIIIDGVEINLIEENQA